MKRTADGSDLRVVEFQATLADGLEIIEGPLGRHNPIGVVTGSEQEVPEFVDDYVSEEYSDINAARFRRRLDGCVVQIGGIGRNISPAHGVAAERTAVGERQFALDPNGELMLAGHFLSSKAIGAFAPRYVYAAGAKDSRRFNFRTRDNGFRHGNDLAYEDIHIARGV